MSGRQPLTAERLPARKSEWAITAYLLAGNVFFRSRWFAAVGPVLNSERAAPSHRR